MSSVLKSADTEMTAAEWQAEFSTVESIVSGVESGLNHDVDNIAA